MPDLISVNFTNGVFAWKITVILVKPGMSITTVLNAQQALLNKSRRDLNYMHEIAHEIRTNHI